MLAVLHDIGASEPADKNKCCTHASGDCSHVVSVARHCTAASSFSTIIIILIIIIIIIKISSTSAYEFGLCRVGVPLQNGEQYNRTNNALLLRK